jgi:hypothetical protein
MKNIISSRYNGALSYSISIARECTGTLVKNKSFIIHLPNVIRWGTRFECVFVCLDEKRERKVKKKGKAKN